MYEIYQINNNETLDEISNKLKISTSELVEINGIDELKNIYDGKYIIIPKRNDEKFITYIVQNGDTIYNLASKYNLDYKQLLNLNGLDKDEYIYPGEELIIPNEGILFWITGDNETLNDVANKLNTNIDKIIDFNNKIYLKPEQLFIIKKKD